MFRILQQPYPLLESRRARWRMSLLFGLFVFLFLWLFEPVGFNQIAANKAWHALGYGLVCTGTMLLLNVALVQLFPRFFRENCWTTGRQIAMTMANIGLIGLGNALYTGFALGQNFGWGPLLYFELVTLGIGLFPVAASFIFNQLLLERRYRLGSGQLNAQLEAKQSHLSWVGSEANSSQAAKANPSAIDSQTATPPATSSNGTPAEPLLLKGDNQNEQLALSTHDLLYIQAADNYVEVHWRNAEGLQKSLLRGSMRTFAEQLATYPAFFRCHKSYIVNRLHIEQLSGNAQGYKLHLRQLPQPIPVSRSLNAQLGQLLG